MARILGVMLTVADIGTMTEFFTGVLSFTEIARTQLSDASHAELYGISDARAEFVTLKLGDEYLYLMSFRPHGKPFPIIHSNDLLFQHIALVVSDLDKAHEILAKHGISGISEKPITIPEWNQAAAGIKAFYFKSPEGHPLELIYFPQGKGHKHWQQKHSLLLGIDHTAIAVSQTDKSLKFYRDQLGMTVFGKSLNYGDTQESLTNVPGAKVEITGLGYKEAKGMNLEFLHYQEPRTGAPIPDLHANDLACTYTVIEVDELDKHNMMQLSHGKFISNQIEAIHTAIFVKDPDGHRLLLVKKE